MSIRLPRFEKQKGMYYDADGYWEFDAAFNFVAMDLEDGIREPMSEHEKNNAIDYFKNRNAGMLRLTEDYLTARALTLGLFIRYSVMDPLVAMNDVRELLKRAGSDEERDRFIPAARSTSGSRLGSSDHLRQGLPSPSGPSFRRSSRQGRRSP